MSERTTGRADKNRLPKAIDAARLERAALHYLERYSSSADNLRRVLQRRVERVCRQRGDDAEPFGTVIDDIVRRCLSSGLVDDRVYAQGKVASLRRRGQSSRMIAAKLSARGVDRELVAATLADHDSDDDRAAFALARRRRIGPFRVKEREAHRDRDLAVLARAGFPYAIARRVIDGGTEIDEAGND